MWSLELLIKIILEYLGHPIRSDSENILHAFAFIPVSMIAIKRSIEINIVVVLKEVKAVPATDSNDRH